VTEAVELTREANDYLIEAMQLYPKRFAGFATLPTAAPDIAAEELSTWLMNMVSKEEISTVTHEAATWMINFFGRFWSGQKRSRFHSTSIQHCHRNPDGLSRAAWGWHIETAVHVLRLILSGAFDQFPDLQIVIGHMGEALPFMMPRIDKILSPNIKKLNHPVADYLRENIYYTFSGFNFTQTFLNLYLQVGADRIMFSADYPYSPMAQARNFLDQLPVSPGDQHKIAHGNAECLLRL